MLRFADDIVVLAEKEGELRNTLNGMGTHLGQKFGLKIYDRKTRVMKRRRDVVTCGADDRIRGNKDEGVT